MIVLVASEVLKITYKKLWKWQWGFFFLPSLQYSGCVLKKDFKVKMSMYENSVTYNDFKIFFLILYFDLVLTNA